MFGKSTWRAILPRTCGKLLRNRRLGTQRLLMTPRRDLSGRTQLMAIRVQPAAGSLLLISCSALSATTRSRTHQRMNIPIRILEPRRPHVPADVHIALEGQPGEVVVLESDALFLQRSDDRLDIIDHPRHGGRLVRTRKLRSIHE